MNPLIVLITGCLLFPFANGFISKQLNAIPFFSGQFTKHQIAQHITGTFFIILVIVIATPPFNRLMIGWNTMATTWLLIAGTVIIAINTCMIFYPELINKYPHITDQKHRPIEWTLHILTWCIYLFCYEWLLRGWLLMLLIPILGAPSAIIINVLIYAWMHLHKGKQEIAGSIPFGILLCTGMYFTKTVLLPFFLHLLLALSFESMLLLKNNFHHTLNKKI